MTGTHPQPIDPASHPPQRRRSRSQPTTLGLAIALAGCLLGLSGCSRDRAGEEPPAANSPADTERQPEQTADSAATASPDTPASSSYEATAEQLLSARLPAKELAEGWVRLFDGHTLFGWEIAGDANFHLEDGTIVVDQGEACLMCTSTSWGDFELTLEFNADAETNSGVFVRTPLKPEDPETECYEINIAPPEHPFPTGSLVGRQRVDEEAAVPPRPGQWRTLRIRCQGDEVTVQLDGTTVCEYRDPNGLPPGRIGLQHNQGRVAFRNLKARPLGLEAMLDDELSQWKKYPEMPGDFSVTEDGELHVVGGRTQLETRQRYGDFFMLAQYKIDEPDMNSGIFFRCIPGDEMMGYECQINNDFENGSRLSPADCGTGGIFRRQDARVVAGENGRWSTVLLHASGPKIAAWVEGIQVSDWEDTRPPHKNPRRGKRLEPGTIMIQGHDPGTDLLMRNLRITSLGAAEAE